MKNIVCTLWILLWAIFVLPAQNEKTVLFLIPFFSDQYNASTVAAAKEEADMQAITSFQMMGFWAGAQIALDEYAAAGIPLKVIVKDVSDNESKLRSIMENKALMDKVDLIIGPFLGKQFAIAAHYAKEYKIPIVNPFSTRTDFLNNNEFVYKLLPALESRPATIAFLSDLYPKHQILIHADSTRKTKELQTYKNYFKEHAIPYKVVPLSSNLINHIKEDIHNIIIVLDDDAARSLLISRDLIYKTNLDNITMVVPDSWLNIPTYDVEYYSKLNLHFFSNYHVDNTLEQTKLFEHNYTDKFKTPPTITSYSYQGYDVTKFFIDLIRNDMDLDRVKIETISYRFTLDKIPGGGYENVNVQLLEIKDNDIIPSRF